MKAIFSVSHGKAFGLLLMVSTALSAKDRSLTTAKYDRFTDQTTISTQEIALNFLALYNLQFSYSCPGKATDCPPEFVTMTFTAHTFGLLSENQGWCCANHPSVIFLADDVRILPTKVTWKGSTDDKLLAQTTQGATYEGSARHHSETITGVLTLQEYLKLASAAFVELKVGEALKPFKLPADKPGKHYKMATVSEKWRSLLEGEKK